MLKKKKKERERDGLKEFKNKKKKIQSVWPRFL